jgi:hypothetical protein
MMGIPSVFAQAAGSDIQRPSISIEHGYRAALVAGAAEQLGQDFARRRSAQAILCGTSNRPAKGPSGRAAINEANL